MNTWKISTARGAWSGTVLGQFAHHADRAFISNEDWMMWQGCWVLAVHCGDDKWRVFACAGCGPLDTPSPEFDTPEECMQWLAIVVAAERSSQ